MQPKSEHPLLVHEILPRTTGNRDMQGLEVLLMRLLLIPETEIFKPGLNYQIRW